MKKREYKEVRLPLKGEMVKQFFEIKEELGLDADTEVLRFLIREFYKTLKEKEGKPLILSSDLGEREPPPNLHPTTPTKVSDTLKKLFEREEENR